MARVSRLSEYRKMAKSNRQKPGNSNTQQERNEAHHAPRESGALEVHIRKPRQVVKRDHGAGYLVSVEAAQIARNAEQFAREVVRFCK